MTTINVNLTPCDPCCEDKVDPMGPYRVHVEDCPGKTVLVPLSLGPWRSVTMKVRLGECDCLSSLRSIGTHASDCRSRPIEVTCSIRGATWPESEVAECNAANTLSGNALWAVIRAVNDRWAVVKALVLGMYVPDNHPDLPMFAKRDAVYAALANVARMERAIFEAQGEYTSAMDEHHHHDWHRDPESYVMPSQKMLALCVQRLIEQVGALS